jgi:hypothetical protein
VSTLTATSTRFNSKLHEILSPIPWKEAAECPQKTTGRVFAHLIRTNNLKPLRSVLALGALRRRLCTYSIM